MSSSFCFSFLFQANAKVRTRKQVFRMDSLSLLYKVVCLLFGRSLISFASGQVVVGGWDGSNRLSSVELFPPPADDTCSIPDLPDARRGNSLSLLPGGRLVVCGGDPASRFCISWKHGSTSWTHLYTTRSSYHIFYTNKELTFQHGKESSCGLGSTIFPQLHRAARRRR